MFFLFFCQRFYSKCVRIFNLMGSARCVRDSFRFSVFSSLNFLFCPFFSLLKFRTRGYWLFFVVSIICLSFFFPTSSLLFPGSRRFCCGAVTVNRVLLLLLMMLFSRSSFIFYFYCHGEPFGKFRFVVVEALIRISIQGTKAVFILVLENGVEKSSFIISDFREK